MPRLSPRSTAFGSALSAALSARGLSQTALARLLGKKVSYVNQVMTGRRRALPKLVDLIAAALETSPRMTAVLHQAAAKDSGYKIRVGEP